MTTSQAKARCFRLLMVEVCTHSSRKSNKKSLMFCSGVGLVMRTGFCTQKGELLRSISCCDDNVSVNNKEALAFMGVLLVFAVAASSYVLNHGWSSGKTTHFKLLMRCIMIITTVRPLELQPKCSFNYVTLGHPSRAAN